MSFSHPIAEHRAGAILTIDLAAIADNYRFLRDMVEPAACGAAIKADAYGLGLKPVAQALWDAGCRVFYVAHLEEAIELRGVLEEAEIHLLHGPMEGCETDLVEFGIVPVLNSLHDMKVWQQFQGRSGLLQPADLHVDTGMTRLGLSPSALGILKEDSSLLHGLSIRFVMSHLACGDDINNPLNRQQLLDFKAARAFLPQGQASFANSPGIFHGEEAHFDMSRPGCALYGVNPTPHQDNPMKQVIRLQARVLQVYDIDAPRTVGYGASFKADKGQRIATVSAGYADGFLRSLSNAGVVYAGDIPCPIAGRVSMDMISIDVTDVPESQMHHGSLVDLVGPHNPVDVLAKQAGTIGYEILTSLGHRYYRCYVNGPAESSDLV